MKVGIRCAPMALLAIFAWSFSLSAQQTKSFLPVLAGTEAMDLGLALSNSSAVDATVNLTARDYSGSLITGAGITNPTTIVVPRNGQRAMRTVEIFGSGMANKTGWVELTADAAIKGFFLLFDSRVSFIDGTDLQSTPSRQLIFQRVTANAATASTISFVNTTSQSLSNVTLTVYNGLGVPLTKTFDLGPYSGFSGPLTDLITTTASIDGYAVLEVPATNASASALIGLGTYRNTTDIAALNPATDSSRMRRGYLPHLATGGGYTTRFGLINYSANSQIVRVTAEGLDQAGHGPPFGFASVDRTIPPYGTFAGSVADLLGITGQGLVAGYLTWEVPVETDGLVGYLDYGTTDGILLSAVPAQLTMPAQFLFSHVAEAAGYYTGLALLNINSPPASVSIEAFSPNGQVTGSTTMTLNPGERRAQLLRELMPEISGQLGGYVRVVSSQPLFAFQLFGSSDSLRFLANVPAQPLGASQPIPQPPPPPVPARLTLLDQVRSVSRIQYQIQIFVADSLGFPVPGVKVTFNRISGSGLIFISNAITSINGETTASVNFNGLVTPSLFEASVAGVAQKLSINVPPLGEGISVTSITPFGLPAGSTLEMTLIGTNLDRIVGLVSGGIKGVLKSITPTQITATIDVPANEPLGTRSINFQTFDGIFPAGLISVVTPSNLLADPSVLGKLTAGGQIPIEVSTNLPERIRSLSAENDSSITFTPLVRGTNRVSSTVIIAADAQPGPRRLLIETDHGVYSTLIQLFVFAATPPEVSIYPPVPAAAIAGRTTRVRFNYIGLDRPIGIVFFRDGSYDPSILVAEFRQTGFSPTIYEANVSIASIAVPGERAIVVITARGSVVTNQRFTVQ